MRNVDCHGPAQILLGVCFTPDFEAARPRSKIHCGNTRVEAQRRSLSSDLNRATSVKYCWERSLAATAVTVWTHVNDRGGNFGCVNPCKAKSHSQALLEAFSFLWAVNY